MSDSQWKKNAGVLGSFGTNNDGKMRKYIEESNEYYGTQLFKELNWDSEDEALLNSEDPDLLNAEKEYLHTMKRMAEDASKRMQSDGAIRMVEDKEFLEISNKEPYVVLCMWHKDFFRTDVLLDHLKSIAIKQPNTVTPTLVV